MPHIYICSLLFFPSTMFIVGTAISIAYKRSSVPIKEDKGHSFVVIEEGAAFEAVCSLSDGGLQWRLPSNTDLLGFDGVDFESRDCTMVYDWARVLRITHAKPSDSGFYKCFEMRNETNFWEFYVYVKGDASFLQPAYDSLVVSPDFVVPCRASFYNLNVTLLIDGVEKKDLEYDPRVGFKLNETFLEDDGIEPRVFECETRDGSMQFYVDDQNITSFEDANFTIEQLSDRLTGSTLITCVLQKAPRLELISKHRLHIECTKCEDEYVSNQRLRDYTGIMAQMNIAKSTSDDNYACNWSIEENGVRNLYKSIDISIPPEEQENTPTSHFVAVQFVVTICLLLISTVLALLCHKCIGKIHLRELKLKESRQLLLTSSMPSTVENVKSFDAKVSTMVVSPPPNARVDLAESILELGDLIHMKPIDFSELDLGAETHILGEGAQSLVVKGEFKGETVAVKKYFSNYTTYFEEEVHILLKMKHRNLLQIIGHVDVQCSIVLEYCPSSLFDCIHNKSFTLDWVLFPEWVTHLVEGFHYLHQNNVIHRDMKSSNVLVSKDNVLRICDFGVSRVAAITECTIVTHIGTPCYEAPEITRRENYTRKVDVYSFGVVLWEMATRRNPCYELTCSPVKGDDTTKKLPPTFLLMISMCTKMDPEQRPSFLELREGSLWDIAQSDIRKNKKDWPEKHEDAQLSANGWNYTMDYDLAVDNDINTNVD